MPALLIAFLLLLLQQHAFAQGSDFISVRKWNGRAIKTFYAGSSIALQTNGGATVNGIIRDIRADSVFIVLYDVRRFQSGLGVPFIDTVATYAIGLHYKQIRSVQVPKKSRAGFVLLGRAAMWGGGGYAALNLINGGETNPDTEAGKANLKRLAQAAGVFIAGFIIKQQFKRTEWGRRQKIVYINLQPAKQASF